MAWISGNRYLTRSETENNATLFTKYFLQRNWSKNAIAAMLGNIESESGVNPGIWENLTPFSGGYGLVQWTPYTNYSIWAGTGWQDNGPKECGRIIYEKNNGLQWISTSEYPMSFDEFHTSDDDVRELAYAFLYNYERPADKDQPQRQDQAEEWFDFISDITAQPIWLYFKFKENKRIL